MQEKGYAGGAFVAKKRVQNKAAAGVPANAAPEAGGQVRRRKKFPEPKLRIAEGSIDYLFAVIVAVLLVFGLIMMFSASYMEGLLSKARDGYLYLKVQLIAAAIGLILLYFISILDYHIFLNSRIVFLGYIIVVALLTFTTFKGVGKAEAIRWIQIPIGPGFNFQPSEAAKAVLIIVLSYIAVRKMQSVYIFGIELKGGWMLIAMAPICLNMVFQRHISGLIIMVVIYACILFMSGMSLKSIIKLGAILGGVAVLFVFVFLAIKENGFDYILTRVSNMWISPETEMNDDNYQSFQSLIAMGSGGWFGLGFGASRQKYLWLPEAQNDFIIAIIVEELGFIGGLAVVALFLLFIIRGFRIAKTAPDKFGTLIVSGIVFQIGFQAIFNIGVACNAIPNTGVALPFFSYGGSAMIIQLAEMGVVLSVSRQCNNI